MFFTAPLSAQVPNTRITQLECQISGSEELMGSVDRIREIVHIQVFDDSTPKIMIKGIKTINIYPNFDLTILLIKLINLNL